jgi:class 3 adenylate cyclase/CHASE2 domain-containing sensor protein
MASKPRSKLLSSKNMSLLIGILIIAIMILLLRNSIIIDVIESKSMNLNFFMTDVFGRPEELSKGVSRISKGRGVRDDIAIFGFDEKSLAELGRFPWPRSTYARFLSNVNRNPETKPTGILMDVFFTENSDKTEDLALAESLKANRDNTVIDLLAAVSKQNNFERPETEIGERIKMLMPSGIQTNDASPQVVDVVTPPIKEIIRSNVKIAPPTAWPGLNSRLANKKADQTVRRFSVVVKIGDRYFPSTALWLAMLYYKVGLTDIQVIMGKNVVLKGATVPESKKTPSTKRDIVIPIDDQGALLINFYGSPGTFQVRTFSDVVNGRVSAKYFKNKIVLAGVYAEAIAAGESRFQADVHITPYGPMYGIEVIANAMTQILNEDFIHMSKEWITIALMIFFGLFISYTAGRRSILISYITTFVLVLVYFVVVVFLFDRYRYALNLSAPLITGIITLVTMIVYRILTEEKEKKVIKGMFSNYVGKSILDELQKHPEKLELGGEDKEITVFFSDIRGFTTLSERLTPQELVTHLNEYLSAMTDIIFKYEGTLDKYVGDEIMAFWNAPVEQKNHVELACLASLEMMSKLRELNASWPEDKRFNIGIGLNTGTMTVGNMGSKIRMNYTLMGDNVNLGARLEGTNKFYSTNIIISEFTFEHIKDKFVCRELDTIQVKGKKKPVKIFEIMDTASGVLSG